MSKNNNKLYNNLVNTLGVTKELVMEQVNIRVEDLLSKHLESKLNSNYIEKLILDRITEIVKAGFINRSWCSRDAFDDYVKNTINNILVKKLNTEYELDLKIIKKDAIVVRSVT